jgi:hypothetical protein
VDRTLFNGAEIETDKRIMKGRPLEQDSIVRHNAYGRSAFVNDAMDIGQWGHYAPVR